MLNQQPYETVKSSFHSKDLKSFLVGKFIKSKLYLLILLTVSTGGFFIGSSIIPEQIPPAQANQLYKLFVQEMPRVIDMYSSDFIQIFCRGSGYSTNADHVAELYQWVGNGWRSLGSITVPYGDRTEPLRFNNRGNYRLIIKSQSEGTKTTDVRVY
jgi:hypothetical protein